MFLSNCETFEQDRQQAVYIINYYTCFVEASSSIFNIIMFINYYYYYQLSSLS
jgi:hypothetical protein